jgi:hypothetical protein
VLPSRVLVGALVAAGRDPGGGESAVLRAGGVGPDVADPAAYQFNCTFTAWHPETGGANRSEPER